MAIKKSFLVQKMIFSIFAILMVLSHINGSYMSYTPSPSVKIALWGILFPLLLITLFYFIYLKEDGPMSIQNLKGGIENSKLFRSSFKPIWVKIIGPVALLAYSFCAPLGFTFAFALATDYLATQPFNHHVTVISTKCDHSQRFSSKFELRVKDKSNNKYDVDFPSYVCHENMKANHLQNQSITLHGRQWALGKIYKGYSH